MSHKIRQAKQNYNYNTVTNRYCAKLIDTADSLTFICWLLSNAGTQCSAN